MEIAGIEPAASLRERASSPKIGICFSRVSAAVPRWLGRESVRERLGPLPPRTSGAEPGACPSALCADACATREGRTARRATTREKV